MLNTLKLKTVLKHNQWFAVKITKLKLVSKEVERVFEQLTLRN